MNLIILTEKDYLKKDLYQINDDRFTHITKILKSNVGDTIEIGLLNSSLGTAKILEINTTNIILEIIDFTEQKEISPKIDIICALPRPQTLKKVLSTCATMGVRNLYLIRSEKVEKSYFHSKLLVDENYTQFLIEGLSQGKRTTLPQISVHKKFKVFFENELENNLNNSTCLLAHPTTENYLDKLSFTKFQNIIIAIGPEGGWNDFEIDLMEKKGFTKFKLSESILRVENAVTASLSQIELVTNK